MAAITLLQSPDESGAFTPPVARPRRPAPSAPVPVIDDVLRLEDLAMAIGNRIGLPAGDAQRDAGFLMDIFGFDDRVIDNVPERRDRQLFYILEEEGMLTTEREETTLYDGREWRTHYWLFKKNIIKQMADDQRGRVRKRRAPASEEDLYSNLPEDAWGARRL